MASMGHNLKNVKKIEWQAWATIEMETVAMKQKQKVSETHIKCTLIIIKLFSILAYILSLCFMAI